MLKLFLLGRPYLEVDGKEIHLSRRKNLALLAYLVLATEARQREELIALLWPELDAHHAHTALRRDLWVLKGKGMDGYLQVTHDCIALPITTEVWCDVTTFQQLLAANELQNHDATTPSQTQLEQWVTAVQLYRDDFMRGFSLRDSPLFDEWQLAQSESLRHQLMTTLEALISDYTQTNPNIAINYAQRLLEIDPLHELTHQRLMRLFVQINRPTMALQQFKHCAHLLADNLNAPPSAQTSQLFEEIQSSLTQNRQTQPANTDDQFTDGTPTNGTSMAVRLTGSPPVTPAVHLPAPSSPFVGRADELAQIAQLLATLECRLLTILGAGGVGKTRLAIEAGRQQQSRFVDLYFVSLASLRHPELLAAAILEGLGVMRQPDRFPEETLIAYLKQRQSLLILDNFEHLLAGVGLVERILGKCSKVKVLITTRERLNIADEWLLPIDGMPYPLMHDISSPSGQLPDPLEPLSAPDDSSYDALQLFNQCARRLQPAITFSESDQKAIAAICQLVSGIPLAIELAASWLGTLSCSAIADALRHDMNILTSEQSGIVERQRSMRSTLDYSWRLAKPTEQIVLAKLSLFQGGFVPHFAQAIADADPVMLRSLVDKSWLHRLPNGRLEMHELIRQFCAEKLQDGRLDPQIITARHRRAYANFMHERQMDLHDQRQVEAVHAIIAERANLRAAWDQALAVADFETLDQMLDSFYIVGIIRNWHNEMIGLLEHAIAKVESTHKTGIRSGKASQASRTPLFLPRLRLRLGNYLAAVGRSDSAEEQWQKSLQLLERSDTQIAHSQEWKREKAHIFAQQSMQLLHAGHQSQAIVNAQAALDLLPVGEVDEVAFVASRAIVQSRFALGEQSESLALLFDLATQLRQRGELWLRTIALGDMTYYLRVRNETTLMKHYTQERMALCEALGDQIGVAYCWMDMGFNALFADTPDLQTAQECFDQLVALNARLQNPVLHGSVALGLGQLAYFKKEWAEARRILEANYAFNHEANLLHDMTLDNLWLGEVALEEGLLDEAQRRFLGVLNHAGEMGSVAVILLGLEGVAKTSIRKGNFHPALAVLALISKHPNTWEFARGRVKKVLQAVRSEMPDEEFSSATQRGATMDFSEAIAWGKETSLAL